MNATTRREQDKIAYNAMLAGGSTQRSSTRSLCVLMAAAYIGLAVGDGRPIVIAVECRVAAAFVVLAAARVTGPAWPACPSASPPTD